MTTSVLFTFISISSIAMVAVAHPLTSGPGTRCATQYLVTSKVHKSCFVKFCLL